MTFIKNIQGARITGSITASFAGDGSGLTNVNASASIAIKDEGVTLTSAVGSIDFVGTGVSASAAGGNVTVTINGGGGSVDTGSLVTTSSFNSFTSSYTTGSFTGSFSGNGSGLTGVISSSYAESASYALNALSSSYALTSANTSDILIYVKNTSGASIAKGKVVRISGATGDNALIATASYEADSVSANTLGILNETIANDAFGYAMTEGKLLGINTNEFTAGQLLFLGPTGSIIGYDPQAPLHAVRLGQVLRVQSINGSMYVRIDNGYELDELHNVLIVSGSDGDLLVASGSNGNGKKLYINSRQLTGSYGLTGSLGVTQNLTVTGNTTITNGLVRIQGNSSNELVRITQLGTGNAFVVEDSTNPDSTPFVIDNTGNVGIGTSAPSRLLSVNGVFGVQFSDTTESFAVNPTSTGVDFVIKNASNPTLGEFRVDTRIGQRAAYYNGGNFTIGSTADDGINKLQVIGSARITNGLVVTSSLTVKGTGAVGAVLDTDTSSDFQSTRLFFKMSGSGNDVSMRNLSGSLLVSTQATAGVSSGTVTAMFISSSGNVAIGNTQPTLGNLQVLGNVYATSFTGSLQGVATSATTASYVNLLTQNVIISGSLNILSGSQTLTTSNTLGSNTFNLNSNVNLGLNAGGSAGIEFTVNAGSNAMYITSASQVVIGNPRVAPVNANATLHVTNVGTQNSFLVEDTTNPDATPFVIDNAGNVGIGTSSPSRILHTSGSTNITSVPLFEGMASSETRFLTIKRTDGTAEAFINYTGADLAFGANSRERLRIGRYGDIAIGTTSSAAGARLYLTGNDDGNTIRTTPLLIASASANTDLVRFTQTGTGNSFVVEDTNTPDSSQFVIDNVGNVGVGTTTPNSKLEVNGNTIITGSLTVTGSINSYDNITLLQNATYLQGKNSSNVTTRILGINSSNLLYIGSVDAAIGSIFFNINGSNLLQISSSGDVGLGKSNPTAKLDINGDAIITGSLTVTNNLTVLGSSSIQYVTSSQLNISTNIINVNTNSPSIRFGGLAVNDSGSSPIRSGSLLFDSQNNQWIFVHQNTAGGDITSSALLMGPQTFNNVGSETALTTNRLPKGAGADLGEHLTDSNIEDNGTAVSINSNTEITGSLTVIGNTYITGGLITYYDFSEITPGVYLPVLDTVNDKIYRNDSAVNTRLSISYGVTRSLYDSQFTQQKSVDWGNRNLVNSSGNVVLNWTDGIDITGSARISGSLTVGGVIFGNGGMSMSGSNSVTGSLIISGSTSTDLVRITQNGTGRAFVVEDSTNPDGTNFTIDANGSVGIGAGTDPTYKLYVNSSETAIFGQSAFNNGVYGSGQTGVVGAGANRGVYGYGVSVGVHGDAGQTDEFGTIGEGIGGKFSANTGYGSNPSYSVQLQDTTEGIGKVLVSQTADGKANWSTRLSGSYEITGSLTVSGSYNSPAGNTIDSNALVQASLLYLSNNF